MRRALASFALLAALAGPASAQQAMIGPMALELNGYIKPNAMGQVPSMVGGVAPSIIAVLNSNVASSTSSDTNCYSGTVVGAGTNIPANGPYIGNTYRLLCSGVYSVGVSVSSATMKIKFGSATIASATTASLPVSVSNLPFLVDVRCTIRSIGASGGMVCSGIAQFSTAATTAPPVIMSSGASPVAIDTTVANTFQITSALTSIIGSPSITATGGSIEVLY